MGDRRIFYPLCRFFKWLYLKLFRINDSPHKIAFGIGIGVFLGIMPGTGPIAALAFAHFFKLNKASAFIGSIITNTWLSIPVFLAALKAGSAVTGVSYTDVYSQWHVLTKNFHFKDVFSLAVFKIILPILTGYFVISLAIGVLAYLVVFIVVKCFRKR